MIDEKQHTSDLTELGRNAIHPENRTLSSFHLPTIFMEIDADKSMTPQQSRKPNCA
ncbi:MAG: hypothetical protein ACLUKN_06075 [Bacilli bacterium]